jgi:hypothetical protein
MIIVIIENVKFADVERGLKKDNKYYADILLIRKK